MIAQVAAFTFVVWGLKYSEPSVAGIVGLLEIVFAAIFGYLIFGENLTVFTFIGGGLILLSASLPNIAEVYQQKVKARVKWV